MRKRDRDQPESPDSADRAEQRRKRRRRNRALASAAMGVLVEAAVLKRRGYGFAGNVIVRCRDGHLSTTIWVPGASVKSLRFGWWRFQRCPVGPHWSLVTPVSRADLTDEERRSAGEHRDVRVP